ncbi:hypothetical protein EDB83DRAFT_2331671 [Lactarius deliciosus]|nr:hypothetical protein EDB83DRAFT_2331671 [Lactarius deliciosus]
MRAFSSVPSSYFLGEPSEMGWQVRNVFAFLLCVTGGQAIAGRLSFLGSVLESIVLQMTQGASLSPSCPDEGCL